MHKIVELMPHVPISQQNEAIMEGGAASDKQPGQAPEERNDSHVDHGEANGKNGGVVDAGNGNSNGRSNGRSNDSNDTSNSTKDAPMAESEHLTEPATKKQRMHSGDAKATADAASAPPTSATVHPPGKRKSSGNDDADGMGTKQAANGAADESSRGGGSGEVDQEANTASEKTDGMNEPTDPHDGSHRGDYQPNDSAQDMADLGNTGNHPSSININSNIDNKTNGDTNKAKGDASASAYANTNDDNEHENENNSINGHDQGTQNGNDDSHYQNTSTKNSNSDDGISAMNTDNDVHDGETKSISARSRGTNSHLQSDSDDSDDSNRNSDSDDSSDNSTSRTGGSDDHHGDDDDDEDSDNKEAQEDIIRRANAPDAEGTTEQRDIRVGHEHQAQVPSFQPDQRITSRQPTLVWKRDKISTQKLDGYFRKVANVLTPYIYENELHSQEPYTPLHSEKIDKHARAYPKGELPTLSTMSTSSSLSTKINSMLRECDTDALLANLHDHNYNVDAAAKAIAREPRKFVACWTVEDKELFNSGFRRYSGSLRMIAKGIAPTKDFQDVIDYQYRFKIPDQFRRFQEKKREQAVRMMECIETRRYASSTFVTTGDKSNPSDKDGSSKRAKTGEWAKTSTSDVVGKVEARRAAARQFLLDVEAKLGKEKLADVANAIKNLHDKSVSELRSILLSDILQGHADLQQRCLGFLPRRVRS